MQFSFNVFVYAVSNKQYREAYRLFLREAVFCLDRDVPGPGQQVVFIRGAKQVLKTEPNPLRDTQIPT
jgi:hypothetical protein